MNLRALAVAFSGVLSVFGKASRKYSTLRVSVRPYRISRFLMPGPCHITIVARFAASSWHEVSAEVKSLKAPLFSQLLSGRQPVARAGIIDIIPRAALRRSYQIGGSDRFNYSMAVAVNDLLLVWSCFLEFARRAAGKDWYTKKDDQQLKSVHKKEFPPAGDDTSALLRNWQQHGRCLPIVLVFHTVRFD